MSIHFKVLCYALTMISTLQMTARLSRLSRLQTSKFARRKSLEQWRLGVGLGFLALFGALGLAGAQLAVVYGSLALGLICFLPLVASTLRLDRHLKELNLIIEFLRRQQARQAATYEVHDNDPRLFDHPLQDLGVTGKKSLFHQLNESVSEEGKALLIAELSGHPKSIDAIKNIQIETKHLSQHWWPLLRVLVAARTNPDALRWDEMKAEVAHPFVIQKVRALIFGLITLWIALIALVSFDVLSFRFFAIFSVASMACLQAVGHGFGRAVRLEDQWLRLNHVLKVVDNRRAAFRFSDFDTSLGRTQAALKTLARATSLMSTQSHPLLHIIIHLFVPWSYAGSLWLEKGRKPLEEQLKVLAPKMIRLEVSSALAFCHKFQTDTFPEVVEGECLEVRGLAHPLIAKEVNVTNDWSFPPEARLILLTGSNMSGKSTFLRTLGLNIILSQMGAPVFANSMRLSPVQVFSCLEISDSLRDGFSYFYAEVRKLRELSERLERKENLFYLVDELFRGTNNKERYLGALRVIDRLLHTAGRGIVSSHDLELTLLAEKYPAIVNFHFRDEVKNGEMHFPYRIFDGAAMTTNALKILEREGFSEKATS